MERKESDRTEITDNIGSSISFEYEMNKKEIQDSKKEFECAYCSKKFDDLGNLKSHMERLHIKRSTTNRTFKNSNKTSNISNRIPKRKHYKCDMCSAKFFTEDKKVEHISKVHLKYLKKFLREFKWK